MGIELIGSVLEPECVQTPSPIILVATLTSLHFITHIYDMQRLRKAVPITPITEGVVTHNHLTALRQSSHLYLLVHLSPE